MLTAISSFTTLGVCHLAQPAHSSLGLCHFERRRFQSPEIQAVRRRQFLDEPQSFPAAPDIRVHSAALVQTALCPTRSVGTTNPGFPTWKNVATPLATLPGSLTAHPTALPNSQSAPLKPKHSTWNPKRRSPPSPLRVCYTFRRAPLVFPPRPLGEGQG